MKHLKKIYTLLLITLLSCNGENANDCFQASGKIIQQEVDVAVFSRILVNKNIEMIIAEGADHSVIVETGENLLNDIQVKVEDDQLILSNNNSCNVVRNYNLTKIYVTAPNITEIRSSTQFDVTSSGVLTYPQLTILSEDYENDYNNTGDFYLQINNTNFSIVFNNLSNCFISGQTQNLNINYAAGNSRFEGATLAANNINIFHRSSNDIIINPLDNLQGNIHSTGNIIAVNEPPIINITAHYIGKLVFQN